MKVALYVRVSTEEQAERESIQIQIEKLRRYCDQQGLEVFDTYNDDGVSGDKPMAARPDGARLLRDAERHCFDKVLATRYDRIGRGEPDQTLADIRRINGYGIPVECVEQQVNLTDANGVLMRLIHIGVARVEWMTTAKRTKEGVDRVASSGQFLGGIVPFGYEVKGHKQSARLIPSEETIPGINLSEAEVVQMIYRAVGEQERSCVWVAKYLTKLGVPTVYCRRQSEDDQARGKRQKETSGIWRPSRIRNLIINTTYKGTHIFAKTSTTGREPVERTCPALVTPELWQKAQDALRRNMIFAPKNHKREYLLRGKIKCGCCGLTYVGTAWAASNNRLKVYYACNGKIGYRGQYGEQGKTCPSKAINGEAIEGYVWKDVERFLRNPGEVLAQLADQQSEKVGEADRLRDEAAKLKKTLAGLDTERERATTLLIKGVLDEKTYKKQSDRISTDGENIKGEVDRLLHEALEVDASEVRLASVGDLLQRLNEKLDAPLTWELKRHLIETLVEKITVETIGEGTAQKDKRAEVTIRYCFGPIQPKSALVANYRDRGSWRRPA